MFISFACRAGEALYAKEVTANSAGICERDARRVVFGVATD